MVITAIAIYLLVPALVEDEICLEPFLIICCVVHYHDDLVSQDYRVLIWYFACGIKYSFCFWLFFSCSSDILDQNLNWSIGCFHCPAWFHLPVNFTESWGNFRDSQGHFLPTVVPPSASGTGRAKKIVTEESEILSRGYVFVCMPVTSCSFTDPWV